MLRGLFEGAQYNSEAGAKCAVYSRERTKQGCGVIKEIVYNILNRKKCENSYLLVHEELQWFSRNSEVVNNQHL